MSTEPKKASEEQIALLRDYCENLQGFERHGDAIEAVLDQLERQNAELEHYRKEAAPSKPPYRFRGVGELERTGYIPEGSAVEREQALQALADQAQALGMYEATEKVCKYRAVSARTNTGYLNYKTSCGMYLWLKSITHTVCGRCACRIVEVTE